jgi:hypothetical protein
MSLIGPISAGHPVAYAQEPWTAHRLHSTTDFGAYIHHGYGLIGAFFCSTGK